MNEEFYLVELGTLVIEAINIEEAEKKAMEKIKKGEDVKIDYITKE